MKPSLDRTLKLLWLAIGALLLLFLGAGVVMVVSQAVRNAGAGEDAVRVAREARAPREEPRAVRFSDPHRIQGTATRMVLVEYGRAYQPDGGGYASGARHTSEVVANVIFLDGQGARLLLDRPAHVARIDYPGSADRIERWIVYQIAFDDTNRDGKLDRRDLATPYVTDLEGRSLRPVLRPPLRYTSHQALDAGRMLVYALEPPAGQEVHEDRMRQRAFIYEVASGRLSPYAAMDSAAARAGRILQR